MPIVTIGTSAHFVESSPGVAFDARGDAIVVWRGYRRVGRHNQDVTQAAYRPAGGRFGRVTSLPSVRGFGGATQAVAISPGGRAYVAWASALVKPFIEVATRSRAGRWSNARRVSRQPGQRAADRGGIGRSRRGRVARGGL